MSAAQVTQEIRKIAAETLNVAEERIELELAAGDIPEWDSLGHVSLLQAVEDHFDIAFDVADAIDAESVEDLVFLVKEYQQRKIA